jgi:hypothetical protein
MSGGRLLSIVGMSISIFAFALPASALADNTVEAENMTWPSGSGRPYGPAYPNQDPSNPTVSGYALWNNSTGTGSVTTTQPTALVSVRLRSDQIGTLCQNTPQFSLKIDGVTRATWSLAPSTSYSTFTVDVDGTGTYAMDPGAHTVGISLNNDHDSQVFPCDRNLWVDSFVLTTRPAPIFSATSWRNAVLAPDAPLAADQSPKTALESEVATFGTFVNDSDSFSVPVYTVRADQPTSRIYQDERWQTFWGADATEWDNQMSSVPIPASAKASGPCDGTGDGETYAGCGSHSWGDREIAIYQPSTDTLWEIYHLLKHNGQWAATNGCRISNVSQNNVGCDVQPFPSGKLHGVAATRIPLMVTLQRTREVKTLQINHPVTIHIPHAKGPGSFFVAPALESDGDFMTTDAIQEGTRFRLRASFDVNTLTAGYLRAFATAAQKYGIIVTDKDCENTALKTPPTTPDCTTNPHNHAVTTIVEDPYPTYGATDPYGIDESHALDGFPWSQLDVVAPTQ